MEQGIDWRQGSPGGRQPCADVTWLYATHVFHVKSVGELSDPAIYPAGLFAI